MILIDSIDYLSTTDSHSKQIFSSASKKQFTLILQATAFTDKTLLLNVNI